MQLIILLRRNWAQYVNRKGKCNEVKFVFWPGCQSVLMHEKNVICYMNYIMLRVKQTSRDSIRT